VWGKFVEDCPIEGDITTAFENPFRYRGYYYDRDLGLYYLQSRYYDPAVGRFISPDEVGFLGSNADLTSYNLYAYCSNNPTNLFDPSGHSAVLIGLIIGAIVGFGTVLYTDYKDDEHIFNGSVEWTEYLSGTIIGAALGAGIGYIITVGGPVLTKALSSVGNKFVSDSIAYYTSGASFGTWEDYALTFMFGAFNTHFGLSGSTKVAFDVLATPFASQIVKVGTNRQEHLSAEKYLINTLMRFVTCDYPTQLKPIVRGIGRGVSN